MVSGVEGPWNQGYGFPGVGFRVKVLGLLGVGFRICRLRQDALVCVWGGGGGFWA